MANRGEPLINVVIDSKPKVLTGLGVVGSGGRSSPDADEMATGEEAEPTPSEVRMWNVVSRLPSHWESVPQGEPIGQPVEEEGGSEGLAVMARIGIEPPGDSIPRESGQTSLWSFGTREPD
jgi:hypothetical protein